MKKNLVPYHGLATFINTPPNDMTTTAMTITTESLLARLDAAYASNYPLTNKGRFLESSDRIFDLSRKVVEVMPLCEGVMLVIDEPANFKDAFDFAGAANSKYGKALAMRSWYSCKFLYLDTMTIETQGWSGFNLPKDMEKATKKLEKAKSKYADWILSGKHTARLESVKI